MKALIFLSGILFITTTCLKAQSKSGPLQSDVTIHASGLDTISNTASVSQVIQIPGYQDIVTIQTGITKLTGTPASGFSVKLYGSVDGVKYDYITTSTDTLAVANVAGVQVHTWSMAPSKFLYIKAVGKGFGTQTSQMATTALWRRK